MSVSRVSLVQYSQTTVTSGRHSTDEHHQQHAAAVAQALLSAAASDFKSAAATPVATSFPASAAAVAQQSASVASAAAPVFGSAAIHPFTLNFRDDHAKIWNDFIGKVDLCLAAKAVDAAQMKELHQLLTQFDKDTLTAWFILVFHPTSEKYATPEQVCNGLINLSEVLVNHLVPISSLHDPKSIHVFNHFARHLEEYEKRLIDSVEGGFHEKKVWNPQDDMIVRRWHRDLLNNYIDASRTHKLYALQLMRQYIAVMDAVIHKLLEKARSNPCLVDNFRNALLSYFRVMCVWLEQNVKNYLKLNLWGVESNGVPIKMTDEFFKKYLDSIEDLFFLAINKSPSSLMIPSGKNMTFYTLFNGCTRLFRVITEKEKSQGPSNCFETISLEDLYTVIQQNLNDTIAMMYNELTLSSRTKLGFSKLLLNAEEEFNEASLFSLGFYKRFGTRITANFCQLQHVVKLDTQHFSQILLEQRYNENHLILRVKIASHRIDRVLAFLRVLHETHVQRLHEPCISNDREYSFCWKINSEKNVSSTLNWLDIIMHFLLLSKHQSIFDRKFFEFFSQNESKIIGDWLFNHPEQNILMGYHGIDWHFKFVEAYINSEEGQTKLKQMSESYGKSAACDQEIYQLYYLSTLYYYLGVDRERWLTIHPLFKQVVEEVVPRYMSKLASLDVRHAAAFAGILEVFVHSPKVKVYIHQAIDVLRFKLLETSQGYDIRRRLCRDFFKDANMAAQFMIDLFNADKAQNRVRFSYDWIFDMKESWAKVNSELQTQLVVAAQSFVQHIKAQKDRSDYMYNSQRLETIEAFIAKVSQTTIAVKAEKPVGSAGRPAMHKPAPQQDGCIIG